MPERKETLHVSPLEGVVQYVGLHNGSFFRIVSIDLPQFIKVMEYFGIEIILPKEKRNDD